MMGLSMHLLDEAILFEHFASHAAFNRRVLAEANASSSWPEYAAIAKCRTPGQAMAEHLVDTAFVKALDADVIDPRFTTQAYALAAVEASAMRFFDRPLTIREQDGFATLVAAEWARREQVDAAFVVVVEPHEDFPFALP